MSSDSKRLPEYHFNSPETAAIQAAFSRQTDALESARDDFLLQLFVNTATWGLALWEALLGLETDIARSLEYRRSRVKSKLRGQGVTTAEMIANVAASFTGGEIIVIERPKDYAFDVKFTGFYGVPANIEDLSAAIEEIKPAHLVYQYLYSYLLIRDIHQVMTLRDLEGITLDKFAGGDR